MRRSLVLVAVLALVRQAAGDPPAPAPKAPAPAPPTRPVEKVLTPEQAADAVLAAVKARDDAALRILASKDDPDPWLVADEMVARGEVDAAASFGRAAPRVDVEKLPGYVDSRRGKSDDPAVRKGLARANAALAAKRVDEALDALGTSDAAAPSDVVSIRRAFGRGLALSTAGRLEESATAFLAAADAAERMGWLSRAAKALLEAGTASFRASAFPAARAAWERRLALCERRSDARGTVGTMGNLAVVQRVLGETARSLSTFERVLSMQEALGDAAGAARTIANLGSVQYVLGNYEQALALLERAVSALEAVGDKVGAASALGSEGDVLYALGDYPKALATLERALAALEALGDLAGVAHVQGGIGVVLYSLHEHAKALSYLEPALASFEARGDRAGAALVRGCIGLVQAAQGDPSQALATLERARAEKAALGDLAGEVATLGSIGLTQHRLGRDREALASAHRGVEILARLSEGLAQGEDSGVREVHADAFEVGALAALALEDATSLSWFLEQGRAASLRGAFASRAALEAAVLPDSLRRELLLARSEERQALEAWRRTAASDVRAVVRESKDAFERAQARVGAVAARIEREAKAAATISLSAVDDLAAIAGRLDGGTALVLYGFAQDRALALVVERAGARTVSLGLAKDVEEGCEALLEGLTDPGSSDVPRADALATKVVEPLRLGATVKRVLISPAGLLCYVPLPLLFPGKEVAYTPSGTTHGLLVGDRLSRGTGVLALGDPQYGAATEATPTGRRGGAATRLAPLPATRDEAMAVGTVRLLGRDATESGLAAAVATSKRWRAVHLACHGLVDAQHPMFSSLALTADEHDDGFLTGLEVFGMKVPADLVVLSACETGKGRIYRTEGIVGLTRAFMFAGAPRVLCSLWKVDDAATRALMVKFYELWNPKDGSRGMGAAAALEAAQEHVKSQEKWKHPHYWAAWVLWGLPD